MSRFIVQSGKMIATTFIVSHQELWSEITGDGPTPKLPRRLKRYETCFSRSFHRGACLCYK